MEEPIRVLQIMGIVEHGGVEAVIKNYYTFIDKSKVQFDFVVHKGSNQDYIDFVRTLGAKVYEITPYNRNIFSFTKEIYGIVKKGEYDIVHSNMNAMSGFPLFAAFLAGAKVRILHNHTTSSNSEGLRTVLKKVLRPFAKMFANKYWACSKLAGEWMYGKELVEDGKVTIINNAIDLNKFSFNRQLRNKIRSELQLKDKFVIGHVGRFMKQKNHEFLIDVFVEVLKSEKSAILLLVGTGPLEQTIEKKALKLGIKEQICFLGGRNDVADLYSAMDVFLFPSLYEGLGMVAIEAQYNGLTVIASTEVPNEASISDNIIFINLNDPITKWVDCIVGCKNISTRGNSIVCENTNFEIREESSKIVKLYESFI